MAIVPKCCACTSHGPTNQYAKPNDQLLSSISLYGNAKSKPMALSLREEPKKVRIGSVKASVCSSTETIQSKASFYSNSTYEESTSGSIQFGLLMENLNEIVEILGSKELELLERDILQQIKRPGALKLFHEGLYQNVASTPSLDSNILQLEVPLEKPKDKVKIVRSGKSQERKLKRIEATHKRAIERKSFILKSQKCHQRIISFGWRSMNHYTSKEESEFSEGVKVASKLERIREAIEKETGQPVCYNDWAKAANIDTRTLSQLLVHGSYCTDQLVQCTRPLVIHLVRKFRGIGIAPDDLLQAATFGVLKGAEKFDIKKGCKFSTYIRYWIRKAIFEEIAHNSRIFRMSVRAESMVRKIEKAQRELHFSLGRYPKDEETAKFTGFPLASVRLARRCSRSVRSLDQSVGHGLRLKLKDIIPDRSVEGHSSIDKKKLKDGLLFILEELNPREKQIIALRYGLNDGTCKSLEEVGKHFSLTKECIRKIEKGAIAKLRKDDIKGNLIMFLN
ncbi:RNA polymerase sigma factor [Rhynchospora pubera]|uniref:RNA polymerase sigma factor n=1 Tax=Rhynchospora pubera TaxID=906938 RepID=A0AAV8HU96_9POAL|nr:RNA polymerase sigma factor [Rhynchospora pubera]